jgi:hypothetical protein
LLLLLVGLAGLLLGCCLGILSVLLVFLLLPGALRLRTVAAGSSNTSQTVSTEADAASKLGQP